MSQTERVDALIDRVMKAFPGVSASAQSRYYEEVHQELSPLAREIERQRDELLSLAKRSSSQILAWAEKYGAWNPQWLPPAGDVRLLEDLAEAIAKVRGNAP